MSPIIILVVALVAVLLAWKLLKGMVKTVALVVILAFAAFVVFGGLN